MNNKALSQEPADTISREAVLDALLDYWHDIQFVDCSGYDVYEDSKAVIDELPPVTPKSETVTEFADRCRECGAKYGKLLEQKSGHWIYDRTRDWDGECKYECSECGMGSDVDYAYCMRCGAKMVESQESEDLGDYPDTIHNQFDNMTGSMNL